MWRVAGIGVAERFCIHCSVPPGRSLLLFLSHARIYAEVMGPCLSKLAYISHVVCAKPAGP